jgi:addiction module RelE/StbE family toxin
MTNDYTILFSPPGLKSLKKIPNHIRKPLVEKIKELQTDPLKGQKLTGKLTRFRSLHTRLKNSDYRIAYQVVTQTTEIVIHYVASRENFYKELLRLRPKAF